jgi:hypothetical protein
MESSEKYRSQLRQGPHLKTLPGNVRPDDLRWVHELVRPESGAFDDADRSNRLVVWLKRFFAGAKSSAVPHEKQIMALQLLSEGVAFKAYGAALTVSDKLKLLGGEDCDAAMDFVSSAPKAKPQRRVSSHRRGLGEQMLGWWGGERVGSLKQI